MASRYRRRRATRSTKTRPSRPSKGRPRRGSCAPRETRWLTVVGARHNNLKDIDIHVPLGRFTCVTGVSGSGKSSLVNDILYEGLARDLNRAERTPGQHERIAGLNHLDKVIAIDQSPIGRTPRSNPATYIKVFDEIRALFARLPDARLRGYRPGRFSFNVASGPRGGGRCEACEGNGANRIEMDFLADVWVTCPVCEGHRFTRETLQIQYKGKSIADVLEMDVQQALEHFENVPRVRGMLQTLHDVGLDYIKLGQPSPTLSGGEAQRIKLARELVKKATGQTLYVLDEPTTGLHFDDIRKLLNVLHGFVDAANTVVVIEHNLDVVKTADWIIDLGPEGGEDGGYVVATGTPEQIAACNESHTGRALRDVLGANGQWPAAHAAFKSRRAFARDEPRATRSRAQPAPDARHATSADAIVVRGARQNNLKDVSVDVPRNQITVCTGVSGSGKTSFAIDTVYTEGYRRYVESLSAYARQFLGQMPKPRVDHIEGLSPAICIEQKAATRNPRSTVGTITEVYDYMRVLWSRIGTPYCPRCDVPIGSQTVDQIVDRIFSLEAGSPIIVLAPVARRENETYASLFNRLKTSGYTRVRIDGRVGKTSEATTLDSRHKHRVEVVVDRTIVRQRSRSRISESVEHALMLGNDRMVLVVERVEKVPHSDEATQRRSDEGNGPAGAPTRSRKREGARVPEDATARSAEPQRALVTPQREFLFSRKLGCTNCGAGYEPLSPHHFSFNSPLGWCPTCEGLGVQRGAPPAAIIRHPSRTLLDGAIAGWGRIEPTSPFGRLLTRLCERLGVEPKTPLSHWSAAQRNALLFGTTGEWIDAPAFDGPHGGEPHAPRLRFHWRGFFPAIDTAARNSWSLRHRLRTYATDIPCLTCHGGRIRAEAAAARLGGHTIVEACALPLDRLARFFKTLRLSKQQREIAGEVLNEVRARLRFLIDIGLEYLALSRRAPTLSGGEAQRIRLAGQLGAGLSGVLYVLDEPTIGLHPRDTRRLLAALKNLRDLGNTLLLVEHDREVIHQADGLLDFGPRAGSTGGQIVAHGKPRAFLRERPRHPESSDASLTRAYLRGHTAVPIPSNRRAIDADGWRHSVHKPRRQQAKRRSNRRRYSRINGSTKRAAALADRAGCEDWEARIEDPAREWLVVRDARQHNLRNIDVPIPLGRLACVTGVSGSGKSSLVHEILWPALARKLHRANVVPGEHERIDGVDALDRIVNSDQSPIGTTPSSNPATYTGAFDWIRELFTRLPYSKMRGYTAARFSFNRPGGRCEACEGYGQKCIEMHFMPDVWVTCETCNGRRYNPETLEVKFKGRSIADVLEMRIADALELFQNVPRIRRMLQTLADVGLDYLELGQPAPTLSGGEAQRVKLAAELGKPDTGRTLYILDEPTTGLHFDDVRKLLTVLHRLVDLGNTVLVVEHNLDLLKAADWIIDLGPEAAEAGGRIVAIGTPEELLSGAAQQRAAAFGHLDEPLHSHTAHALAPILKTGPHQVQPRFDPAALARQQLQAERGGLGDVGRQSKAPWQVDGRRWHLELRRGRDGSPRRWEPAALEYVIERVERIPGLAPANWNSRASIEVTAPDAPAWFLHALTGGEWLLELYFRTPAGTFDWQTLDRQLDLRSLDEREDLPVYGDWARVDVRPRADGFDAIVVYVHDRREIDTPAFRRFVKQAAKAYLKRVNGAG